MHSYSLAMVKRLLKLLFKFTLKDICLDHFIEKTLVSVVKKDRDPTISAVRNIHTRFSCRIREYSDTRSSSKNLC